MLFPCIFLCCIRVGQLVIINFHTFFTNNILILFTNVLSCMKRGNIIFFTEIFIQGLSFGSKYSMFCNFLGLGIIFLTATIFPNFSQSSLFCYYIINGIIPPPCLLSLHHATGPSLTNRKLFLWLKEHAL